MSMTVIIVSSVSVIEAVDATDSEQLTTPPQSTDQVQSSHSTLLHNHSYFIVRTRVYLNKTANHKLK